MRAFTAMQAMLIARETGTRLSAKQSVAIGFSLAAAILLLGPYTGYSPAAIDMWYPTAYFTNFSELVERFGLAPYYISRLPYILPGVAVYSILTPHFANFALNLACFGTTVSGLLFVASGQLPGRWATALTVLLALNSYLLFANLSDYCDGPTIAYFIAGLAMTSVEKPGVPRPRRLISVGALWTCALLTNFISAILILPFALEIIFWRAASRRDAIRRFRAMTGGSLLVFFPLMAISRALLGAWFFPAPQIAQLVFAAEHPDFLPGMWGRGSDWMATAYRLAAMFGPMAVAAPCLLVKRCRTPEFVAAFAICAAGALLYLAAELDDKVLVRAVYHGTFLLVFAQIQTIALVKSVLGAATSAADIRLGPRILVGVALVISLLFAAIPNLGGATWLVLAVAAGFLGVMIATPRVIAWRASAAAVASAVLLNLSVASDREVRWIYFSNKDLFSAALQTQAVLRSGIIKGADIRFWYELEDKQEPLFRTVNALYLWFYRDLTKALPTMQEPELHEVLPAGSFLVHMCTGECPMEKRTALLRNAHIGVDSTFSWMVRPSGGEAFTIVVQKTSSGPEVPAGQTTVAKGSCP